MKRLFILGLLIPMLIISCQKEEITSAELDDFVSDLELKVESDEGEDPPCYKILFPLGVIMPDGEVIEGDNKRGLMKNIKSWMRENGKIKRKRLSFDYPIDVEFKGKTISLENEQQLNRVRMACKGDYDRGDKDKTQCIELIYPVSYKLPSGRTFTANSGKELRKMMATWKKNNPDAKARPKMVYPVDVKFRGKELTVENENQMARLKKACSGK